MVSRAILFPFAKFNITLPSLIAPKVMIVDEYGDPLQEKYYEIDSTLQLSCVVRNVAMSSSVVFWKHSENVLNYDVTRGGVR